MPLLFQRLNGIKLFIRRWLTVTYLIQISLIAKDMLYYFSGYHSWILMGAEHARATFVWPLLRQGVSGDVKPANPHIWWRNNRSGLQQVAKAAIAVQHLLCCWYRDLTLTWKSRAVARWQLVFLGQNMGYCHNECHSSWADIWYQMSDVLFISYDSLQEWEIINMLVELTRSVENNNLKHYLNCTKLFGSSACYEHWCSWVSIVCYALPIAIFK